MANIKHNNVGGELSGAEATLYTCPSGARTTWHSASVINTSSSSQGVYIYVRKGGVSYPMIDLEMLPGENIARPEDELHKLGEGDSVRGYADAPNVVKYLFSFVEEHQV